jgi:hypothetical protein
VDKVRHKELANCTCRDLTVAIHPEEFEAEMNLSCPSHGFRRLGRIVHVVFVDSDGKPQPSRLDELIATYEARLEQTDTRARTRHLATLVRVAGWPTAAST